MHSARQSFLSYYSFSNTRKRKMCIRDSFITGGYFTRHLARERTAYKARRDALVAALRTSFAPVSYTHLDVYKRQLLAVQGHLVVGAHLTLDGRNSVVGVGDSLTLCNLTYQTVCFFHYGGKLLQVAYH